MSQINLIVSNRIFRQYDIDEGKALGLIHDLMRERPVYMLQALSNFGARLPNAA